MTAEYAAAIAPEIDRVRLAMVARLRPHMAEFASDGITPDNGSVFSMLRNLAPDRRARVDAVADVFVYQPRDVTDAALADLAARGLVDLTADDVGLTTAGVGVVDRLQAHAGHAVADLWPDAEHDFARLRALADAVIAAAAADNGPAFGVVSPLYVPATMATATVFVEALTPLRFHRFDAHVAAWRAAGLSASEVQALAGDDPLRVAIETDTNARAVRPYTALNAAEQDELLEGLRRLLT
ncbi:MAG TPA: hypothetical protein VHD87_00905 [Acidimicrobiales bacterium]|nr:hypothetical protein [Acidimicrobiales bacterium]